MIRLTFLNPNATVAMTDNIVAAARAALPEAAITGMTNRTGPPAIEGPQDGAAAIPGLMSLIPKARARGTDALVIACFDDTGLAEARAIAACPVLGLGQAACLMAAALGQRFSVVTSVAAAVPVIAGNIRALGLAGHCASVRASGLSVLEIDAGGPAVRDRLIAEIGLACHEDGAKAVVLGCAGMAALAPELAARTNVRLIDGVAAAAHLARATVDFTAASAAARPGGRR